MRRTLAFVPPILFASAILWLPACVMAQHGAMHRGAPSNMGAFRPSVGRSVYAGPVHNATPPLGVRVPVAQSSVRPRPGAGRQAASSTHVRHVNVVPFDNFGETDFGDVPGLGFDFPHLAAISGNRHFGHRRVGGAFPFGFGGFFLPTAPVIIEEAQAPVPPENEDDVDVVSDASDADAVREWRPHRRASAQISVAPSERSSTAPAQPEPDAAEYVFVRRDGGLLFAVGYSWQNGTLRYITRDGIRHSVASEVLDLTATEQFNEQRGLTFHLPA